MEARYARSREQVGHLEAALEGERQRHGEAVEALKVQHASDLRQVRAELAQQELAELKSQATQNHEDAAKWQGRADALQEALAAARQQVDALSERLGQPKDAAQSEFQDDKN